MDTRGNSADMVLLQSVINLAEMWSLIMGREESTVLNEIWTDFPYDLEDLKQLWMDGKLQMTVEVRRAIRGIMEEMMKTLG